ncbi:MAG TPA: hypothetical protein VGR27_09765 [Longimicrobiaceae bacterium]|nr:hypothetical protein [Longimicrobiaceae bacterium]
MTNDTRKDDTEQANTASRSGGGRQGDRRKGDRRGVERRAPPPVWRRPWALVAYGVLGTLLLVLLVNRSGGETEEPLRQAGTEIRTTPARTPVQARDPAAAAAPVQDARSAADFERLVAEGDAAVGQRIRVNLYCESIRTISLRSVEEMESGIAALADASNRVPGAECKWGERTDTSREDFLLLVPPDRAEVFANTPTVQDGFVRRKQVEAEVEWLGRSDALHLRTAGVLVTMLR